MFCSACGQQMQPGARFCMNCGAASSGLGALWTGGVAPAPAGVNTPDGFRTFADFGPRLGACLIDAVIQTVPSVALFLTLIVLVVSFASADPEDMDTIGSVFVTTLLIGGLAAAGWGLGYRWWGNATGRPLGKRLAGIRVVQETTGLPPGAENGLVRLLVEVGLGVISPVNLIDYLWPLWDTRRQTLHDKAAGTVVVRDAVSSPSMWSNDSDPFAPTPWTG